MAIKYDPDSGTWTVEEDQFDETGRYTGARVGSGKSKKKSDTRSVQNVPRNLQGAPMATSRKIMGLPEYDPWNEIGELNDVSEEPSQPRNSGRGAGASAGYNAVLNALSKLAKQSTSTINASQDALKNLISGQANPYAGYVPQTVETKPELTQFLQAQNVPDTALQQFAATINAQNAGQTGAYSNMMDTLRLQQEAMRNAQLADVEQQRGDLLRQLQGNILGTGAALIGKKNTDRNAIAKMLLAALRGRA